MTFEEWWEEYWMAGVEWDTDDMRLAWEKGFEVGKEEGYKSGWRQGHKDGYEYRETVYASQQRGI